jgi:5-methyltetrahydropteroyltriglutamate--homocysteine methyltransferase
LTRRRETHLAASIENGVNHMGSKRILTTHCGSLPRTQELSDLLLRHERGEQVDPAELRNQTSQAVAAVVDAQVKSGIDIISDGEQPRVGFSMYVPLRMSGFGGESKRAVPQDLEDFPIFRARLQERRGRRNRIDTPPKAIADLQYVGFADAKFECDLFTSALKSRRLPGENAFMTAASPGIIATTMENEFYDSYENYVFALARELRKEYELIHSYGFLLQLDAPDFGLERARKFKDNTEAEFLKAMEIHVEAINRAVEHIPRDRIRLHICWGNWEGPHVHDFPLAKLLPILYAAKVGALSIEFANPRHQHEYEALKRHRLPDHMVLLPGVVETTSNIVEHPEVVARRIQEAVAAVGDRERVIASSDCGFETFTRREWVIEPVVWLKLKAMREGADIASSRLWGKKD